MKQIEKIEIGMQLLIKERTGTWFTATVLREYTPYSYHPSIKSKNSSYIIYVTNYGSSKFDILADNHRYVLPINSNDSYYLLELEDIIEV